MKKFIVIGLLIIGTHTNFINAQTVDLSSVDVFFNVTSTLKEGKKISSEQWDAFDASAGYKPYAEIKGKRIKVIKNSINIVFGDSSKEQIDSLSQFPEEKMREDILRWLYKHTVFNYLNTKNEYVNIKAFREECDFEHLIEQSKQRLSSYLERPIDASTQFKNVYFLFQEDDSQAREDGIFVDFYTFYKKTEQARIDFLAHEFFHCYREDYQNEEFREKNELNYRIDGIQNEGIADMIDKRVGYKQFFTERGTPPQIIETWVKLYNQAPEDLNKLQILTFQYLNDEISEEDMEKQVNKIVMYGGHPIGFYMAKQIVAAGFEKKMLNTFHNPYQFFKLYNKAACKQNLGTLNKDFLKYLKKTVNEYGYKAKL